MRIVSARIVPAVLASFLATSCTVDLQVPPTAKVACDESHPCPDGWVCHNAACVPPGKVDTAAPDLASAPVVAPQRPLREGSQLELRLVATEPLSQPPEVTLLFEQAHVSAACTAIEGSDVAYACAQTVTKESNGGRGGAVYFDVRLVDLARNETVKRRAGSFLLDFEPPVVITPTLGPKIARLASDIQLFFTTDGPLDGAAVVEVDPPLGGADGKKVGTFALLPEKDSQNYRLTRKVTEADPDAQVTFTVSMKDLAGNETLRFPLGSVRIDRTLPEITNVLLSPKLLTVSAGIEVAVTFEAQKKPLSQVKVAVGGIAMRADPTVSPPSYRFTHTVAEQDKGGTKPVLLDAMDLAGNVLFESPGAFTFDFTKPTILSGSAKPSTVGLGVDLVYTVTASEKLMKPPKLTITGPGTGPGTLEPPLEPGTEYIFRHPAGPNDKEGDYTVSIALVDEAGNSDSVPGDGFTLDLTPPTLGKVAAYPSRVSWRGPHNEVKVSFEASDPGKQAAPVVTASLDGTPLVCGTTGVKTECSYTVTAKDSEGAHKISVSARDTAGNVGFATLPVFFDFTPPAVDLAEVTPKVAKLGGTIVTTLRVSEPLAKAPVLRAIHASSGNPAGFFSLLSQQGLVYTFHHPVVAGDPRGAYSVEIDLGDEAGNPALKIAGASFSIDNSTPVLSGAAVALGRTKFSAKSGSNLVEVTFKAEDPKDAAFPEVAATLAGRPMRCVSTAPGAHRCTYSVDDQRPEASGGKDTEGPKDIVLKTWDAAGNEAMGALAVELDFTPPKLVNASLNRDPSASSPLARYKAGDQIVLSVTADEPLSGAPLAEVIRADGATKLPFVHQSATRYAFVHSVAQSDKDGEYATQIQLTDAVGNVGPLLAGPKLALDASIPRITKVVHRDRATGKYRDGDTVALAVDASDSDGVAPAVSATLGGKSMTCDPSAAITGSYTCTYKIDSRRTKDPDKEGTQFVLVTAQDGAGNVALSSAAAEFDFTPPTFTASLNKSSFKVGEVLFLTVTASEPLAKAPVLTADGSTTYLALRSNTRYIYEHTIAAGEPRDGRVIKVDLEDEAGNQTLGATDPKAKFTVDSSLPTITSLGTLGGRRTYSGQPLFNEVKVTFTAGDPDDAAPPSVVAKIDGRTMACTATPTAAANTSDYSCAYTVDPKRSPSPDTDGIKGVLLTATDAAGNQSWASTSVTFDFTGPHVVAATVNYLPSPSNPLSIVAKATSGTKLIVSVFASEPIVAAATPSLLAKRSGGAESLDFKAPTSVTGGGAVFELVIAAPAQVPDGAYEPEVTWTDEAGNTRAAAFSLTPGLVIKTTAPVLTVDQTKVSYVRSPWGNGAAEDLGGFTLPKGPYYALAPQDSLAKTASIAAAAFVNDSGTPAQAAPFAVRVWSDSGRAGLLATLSRNKDGSYARPSASFPQSSLPSVWVSGLDDAGNESGTVRIENAEWVATPNKASPVTNPHLVHATTFVQSSVTQDPRFTRVATEADALDGKALLAKAEVAWRERFATDTKPGARVWAAMTFDASRGRTLLFGGNDNSARADTWEWDGVAWVERTPTGTNPAPRSGAGMVYDSARQRVVLYGGCTQDLWEWDGASWVNRTPAASVSPSPPVRTSFSMVYDSTRRVVVLFGGERCGARAWLQDLWEWNGSRWVDRTPSPLPASWPPGRSGHAMAFNAKSGKTILFGGLAGFAGYVQDTWEWDGTTFAARSPSTFPKGRVGHAMAFDSARGRTILFGGSAGRTPNLDDLWEWDGVSWTTTTFAAGVLRPPNLSAHSMVFDVSRSVAVLFGGTSWVPAIGAFLRQQTAWEWDGTTWTERFPSSVLPSPRKNTAMAYDVDRQRTMLFGGRGSGGNCNYQTAACWQVWEWNGISWALRQVMADSTMQSYLNPSSNPPPPCLWFAPFPKLYKWPLPRLGHTMIYFAAKNELFATGGHWGGGSASFPPRLLPEPYPRSDTYCPSNVSPVRISENYDWVWSWDSRFSTGFWQERESSTGFLPSPRRDSAMVYDSARGRAVLFGGTGDNPTTTGWFGLQDTLEWDGTRWSGFPTGPKPPPRHHHAMAFDRLRNVTVLFGGKSANSFYRDTWEWNGGRWTDRTPTTFPASWPSARSGHAMAFDTALGKVVIHGGGGVPAGELWAWDGSTWIDKSPVIGGVPAAREDHEFVDDSVRRRTILFGGENSDLWELDANPARQPAAQFTVAGAVTAGIEPASIASLRVRATAAGGQPPYDAQRLGAALLGWTVHTTGTDAAGTWIPVDAAARNVAGVDAAADQRAPYTLTNAGGAVLDWTSKSREDARRYYAERDGTLAFQVRPLGPSGAGANEAAVALDYIEVRVRYCLEQDGTPCP